MDSPRRLNKGVANAMLKEIGVEHVISSKKFQA
jgi:hypothetical protein